MNILVLAQKNVNEAAIFEFYFIAGVLTLLPFILFYMCGWLKYEVF